MRVNQLSWSATAGWTAVPADRNNADLVFLFGGRPALACGTLYHELRAMFPDAHILMGQHTLEELEAAGAEIGSQVPRLGFYSYGEISPHRATGVCELHNQTMTVTTLAEAVG